MKYRPWIGITALFLSIPVDVILTPAHSSYRGLIFAGVMLTVSMWAGQRPGE